MGVRSTIIIVESRQRYLIVVLSLREGLGTNALFPLNLYGLNKKRFLKGEIMSKINKLGKSTFVIAILSFLLVAVLGFGGTYAYFTSQTTKATGEFTTGKLQLTETSATTQLTTVTGIVPGAPLVEDPITVTADVNVKTIVIAVMKLTIPTGTSIEASDITFAISETNPWDEVELKAGATERAFVLGSGSTWYIESGDTVNFTDDAIYLDNSVESGDAYANQDKTITFELTFYAVQYDYLTAKNGDEFTATTAQACYNAAASLALDGVIPEGKTV